MSSAGHTPNSGTLSEIPVRTLRQQIFNDIASTYQNLIDIDYSVGELFGKSLVGLTTGKVPVVGKVVYGFGTIVNTLQTADNYIRGSPLFGEPDAAPYGTTAADFMGGKETVAHAGAPLNHLIPQLSHTQLQQLALANDSQRRMLRLGHNLHKLGINLKHHVEVYKRANRNGVPISNVRKITIHTRAPDVQQVAPTLQSVAYVPEVAPSQHIPHAPAPEPSPVATQVPVYVPVPVQVQPAGTPVTHEKQQNLMNLAMQRVRW